jgi:hypothetical protein
MTYNTNAITGRISVLNNAKFVAGTYKSGQLLGRVAGGFTTYDASKTDGSQLIAAVCLNDVGIPTGGGYAPVSRGEFIREGVAAVMAALTTPVTLDDALVGQCWDAGIILN